MYPHERLHQETASSNEYTSEGKEFREAMEARIAESTINVEREQFQKRLKNELALLFVLDESTDDIKKFAEEHHLSEQEVKNAALRMMAVHLTAGEAWHAMHIRDKFSLTAEDIGGEEIRFAVVKGVIALAEAGKVEDLARMNSLFTPSEEEFAGLKARLLGVGALIRNLRSELRIPLRQIREQLHFTESDSFNLPEIRSFVLREMIDDMRYGAFGRASDIRHEFNVTRKELDIPEVRWASIQGIVRSGHTYANLEVICSWTGLTEKDFMTSDAHALAIKGVISAIREYNTDRRDFLCRQFKLTEGEFREPEVRRDAALRLDCTTLANYDAELFDRFGFTREDFVNPEVQKRAMKVLIRIRADGLADDYEKPIRDLFDITDQYLDTKEFRSLVMDEVIHAVKSVRLDYFKSLRGVFRVTEDELRSHGVRRVALEVMFPRYEWNSATVEEIQREFNVTKDELRSPEVRLLAVKAYLESLNSPSGSQQIKQKMSLVAEDFQTPAARLLAINWIMDALRRENRISPSYIKRQFGLTNKEIVEGIGRRLLHSLQVDESWGALTQPDLQSRLDDVLEMQRILGIPDSDETISLLKGESVPQFIAFLEARNERPDEKLLSTLKEFGFTDFELAELSIPGRW